MAPDIRDLGRGHDQHAPPWFASYPAIRIRPCVAGRRGFSRHWTRRHGRTTTKITCRAFQCAETSIQQGAFPTSRPVLALPTRASAALPLANKHLSSPTTTTSSSQPRAYSHLHHSLSYHEWPTKLEDNPLESMQDTRCIAWHESDDILAGCNGTRASSCQNTTRRTPDIRERSHSCSFPLRLFTSQPKFYPTHLAESNHTHRHCFFGYMCFCL